MPVGLILQKKKLDMVALLVELMLVVKKDVLQALMVSRTEILSQLRRGGIPLVITANYKAVFETRLATPGREKYTNTTGLRQGNAQGAKGKGSGLGRKVLQYPALAGPNQSCPAVAALSCPTCLFTRLDRV